MRYGKKTMDDRVPGSESEWKKRLTPEQYRVLREKGTEAPFTGKYVNEHAKGMFRCAGCGAQLFSSDVKFDSGTGWPSFTEALPGAVEYHEDTSHGMSRVEVTCARCGGHLGHVFDDLPAGRQAALGPRARRYCINSVCLELEKKKE